MKVKSESEVAQWCLTLHDPLTAAYQAPLSMRFSRQEYWSGLPLPCLVRTAERSKWEVVGMEFCQIISWIYRSRFINLNVSGSVLAS